MLIKFARTCAFAAVVALPGAGAAVAQTAPDDTQTNQAAAPASPADPAQSAPGQDRTVMASAGATDPNAPAGTAANPLPTNSPVPADQAYTLKAGDPTVVTNGPVPDTPSNRAKYGKPMSHAGRRTAPAGN